MKIFTSKNKAAGEMAVREMSDKAREFYDNTDPFNVYEYTDWEDTTWYAYDGCFGKEWGLTFDQMQTYLEAMCDEVAEAE